MKYVYVDVVADIDVDDNVNIDVDVDDDINVNIDNVVDVDIRIVVVVDDVDDVVNVANVYFIISNWCIRAVQSMSVVLRFSVSKSDVRSAK